MANTYSSLFYHLIFSTKNRMRLIDQRLHHSSKSFEEEYLELLELHEVDIIDEKYLYG